MDTSKRFFLNRGKTSCFVTGSRLTRTTILSNSRKVLLVILTDADDLVMNFRRCSPFRENMLRADELNSFRHHRGAAQIHNTVRHVANRWIRSDAACCIGSAALNRDKKV